MSDRRRISRRTFLGWATAAAVGPYVVASPAVGAARPAPSERITIGMIGLGGQGIGRNLRGFLAQPDAQVVAACDVDRDNCYKGKALADQHYARQARGGTFRGCDPTSDFREVLGRNDVDAVCISTPDHWHVPMSVMAVRAGKDVICEKPTLTVGQGRLLADTVRRYGAVFQTSTEDRSLAVYHRMAEVVRSGRIGKPVRVRVQLPAGPATAGDPTPKPVPEGFDWDLWLGPAPWAPYSPARTHWNFRWISDYSGGMLTDWGAHQLDTVQWALDTEGWVGNAGWSRPVEASSPEILRTPIGPGEVRLFTCPAGEHRNFLDCVRTRTDPYQPAEVGHRVASIAHIGNIAMWTGRRLRWDATAETFPGDAEANRYLDRALRAPWAL